MARGATTSRAASHVTGLAVLALLALSGASGATVTCDGKPMEPVEGMGKYIVVMSPGASAEDVAAATAWLQTTYGDADVGSVREYPNSLIGAYFVAEMSWAAVQGLLASEHGAAIDYIECDAPASIARGTPDPAASNTTRSAEEQAALEDILEAKLSCAEGVPDAETMYIIQLMDGTSLSTANLTAWLTENHPEYAEGMESSSLAGVVTAQLPRWLLEELLLRYHADVLAVDCDVLACSTDPKAEGCPPDINGPSSPAVAPVPAAAAAAALLHAALLTIGLLA